MALTLAEAAKLSNDVLLTGVVETIIKDSPVLQRLPFIEIVGNGLTYNREDVAPSAGFFDVGDTWTESTPTFTQQTVALKIMGGDADIDNFLIATRSNIQDVETAVVQLKAKAVQQLFEQTFVTGDEVISPKEFDGLDELCDPAQTISMGVNGGSLTLDKLDELIDAVKGGKPEILLMSRRSRRILNKLARTSGSFLEAERDEFGQMLQFYDGIPVGVSGYISDAQTVGTSTDCSTVYAFQMGEGGLAGLTAPGGLHVERVGSLETKDASRTRIKWYSSLALFNTVKLSRIHIPMTLLKRATIKSYDAGSHRAAVGISGSLSVWLDSIVISDSIPAAAVVAGRECAVLFHSEDNPDDAVVISVHGGGPPSASASELVDADADTKVQVEESADEDKVRIDVAGTERFVLQNAAPHLLLTGEERITDKLTVGDAGATLADVIEIYLPAVGTVTAGYAAVSLHTQGITLGTNDNQGVRALVATPFVSAAAGTSSHAVQGLNFFGVVTGAGNFGQVSAIWAKTGALLYSGTIDQLTTFRAPAPTVFLGSPTINEARGLWVEAYGNSSITDIYGIDVGALTAGANRRGIYVADITAGTIARLLELQSAMYVEGTGNWTPTANETPVIIYEGVTPTARRVKWKAGNVLGAADRVMVLV